MKAGSRSSGAAVHLAHWDAGTLPQGLDRERTDPLIGYSRLGQGQTKGHCLFSPAHKLARRRIRRILVF